MYKEPALCIHVLL